MRARIAQIDTTNQQPIRPGRSRGRGRGVRGRGRAGRRVRGRQ